MSAYSILQSVYAEFSRRLGTVGTVVIAGGAVRDDLMGRTAKDVDVFVLDSDMRETSALIRAACDGLPVITPPDHHNSEPFLVITVTFMDTAVQIMCSPQKSVSDLLDQFDWNVALFAYDGAFTQREDIANIVEGKPLKLQKVTFPLSTLRRGFRFSERFGMVFDRTDIQSLCERVSKMPLDTDASVKGEL